MWIKMQLRVRESGRLRSTRFISILSRYYPGLYSWNTLSFVAAVLNGGVFDHSVI
jgi:hypothetical protein